MPLVQFDAIEVAVLREPPERSIRHHPLSWG
jgi:hypothetical protein